MAVPQIVIAAAPYAGALAFTTLRLAAAGFGLVAGLWAADKAFGFSRKADAQQQALLDMINKQPTAEGGDPVAAPPPTPNGLDPHPAGQA
jgi:hypothetical protein